ncbi:ABEC1 enzyme, partial [Polioptila caerulea]|nr:ABEC1 enzyme [Polioptila caerulea]
LTLLFCFSMYIAKRTLRHEFDPRVFPNETYLLCELEWGRSGRYWQHWVRNVDHENYHAEQFFLEEIFEPRSYNFCNITWYLSWSPCWRCCKIIQDFLEREQNVYIEIRVARLYYPEIPRNRSALWELHNKQGVNYLASIPPDYEFCWRTFTQSGFNYDFRAEDFQLALQRNRLMLEDILQVSTL